ncbi:PREDICTED: 39S ribosomal protein L35, mitochondrial, partial [Ceratosolen solmsi marchali]|uniref:Large ribosomal subunit protein bL35m n=1 Tax=Ceratosolen solmsi marchali TaxID=326594 RepID=A0AAJ7DUV2_9HYME
SWQNNLSIRSLSTTILSNSLNKPLLKTVLCPPVLCRTVTKFSLRSGKRKSVKTVLKRFYRLNWGIWIRTIAGRHKHLWRKSKDRRIRSKQHVFINSTQSWMLDRMVTKFWKRQKYYIDDPYTPYHTREEFLFTQRKCRTLIKQ